MNESELKEFGEAVKRLDEVYPDEQIGLEIGIRRTLAFGARFISRVGDSDTFKFGYGETPQAAVDNLIQRAGLGEERRAQAAAELRAEAQEKLSKAQQLEAANG